MSRTANRTQAADGVERVHLVTFSTDPGQARLGALVEDSIIDLAGAAAWMETIGPPNSDAVETKVSPGILDLLRGGPEAMEQARRLVSSASDPDIRRRLEQAGLAFKRDQIAFLPVIPCPGKIICVGQNYRPHVAEMGRDLPKFPVLFGRFASSLVGHRQPIIIPNISEMVDYEGELAVIVGRMGKDIPAEEASDYIAGYSIFNDVSVRDYQYRTSQWLQGKNFDNTGPFGPALVTADEIAWPPALDVRLRLNGQVMQEGNTSDFIFDLPMLIHYLSQILTLVPGDVISTGTPPGVGYARDPRVFLKPGDTVRIEIAGVGVLENPVLGPHGH